MNFVVKTKLEIPEKTTSRLAPPMPLTLLGHERTSFMCAGESFMCKEVLASAYQFSVWASREVFHITTLGYSFLECSTRVRTLLNLESNLADFHKKRRTIRTQHV